MSKASLLQRFAAASRAAANRRFAASAPEAGEKNCSFTLMLSARLLDYESAVSVRHTFDHIRHDVTPVIGTLC